MAIIRKPNHSVSILTRDKSVREVLNDRNTTKKFSEHNPPINVSHIQRFRSGNGYKLFCNKDMADTLLRGEVTLPIRGEYKVVPTRLFCACRVKMNDDEDISVISAVLRLAVEVSSEEIYADRVLDDGVVRVVMQSPETWLLVRSFREHKITLGGKEFILSGCEFPKRGSNANELERRVTTLERRQEKVVEECTGLGRQMDGIENKINNGLSELRDSLLQVERRNEDRMERMREAQESRDREYNRRLLDMNASFEVKMDMVYSKMASQLSRYLDDADRKRSGTNS